MNSSSRQNRRSRRSSTGEFDMSLDLGASFCVIDTSILDQGQPSRRRHGSADFPAASKSPFDDFEGFDEIAETIEETKVKKIPSSSRRKRSTRRSSLGVAEATAPMPDTSNHSIKDSSSHSASSRRRERARRNSTSILDNDSSLSKLDLRRNKTAEPRISAEQQTLESKSSHHRRRHIRRSSIGGGSSSNLVGGGRQRRRFSMENRDKRALAKAMERMNSSGSSEDTPLAAAPDLEDDDFGFALHGFLLDLPNLDQEEEEQQQQQLTKGKPSKRKSVSTRNRSSAVRLVSESDTLRLNREMGQSLRF